MDVYTEVRNAAGNSETVLENVRFISKRLVHRSEWVSDDIMLSKLAEMPRAITGKEFRGAFPGMTDVQFNRLMTAAKSRAGLPIRTGLHNSFLAHLTSAIKVGLDRATISLARIREKQLVYLESLSRRRSDETCIADTMQSIAVQNHWMMSVQTQLDSLRRETRIKDKQDFHQDDRASQREYE